MCPIQVSLDEVGFAWGAAKNTAMVAQPYVEVLPVDSRTLRYKKQRPYGPRVRVAYPAFARKSVGEIGGIGVGWQREAHTSVGLCDCLVWALSNSDSSLRGMGLLFGNSKASTMKPYFSCG